MCGSQTSYSSIEPLDMHHQSIASTPCQTIIHNSHEILPVQNLSSTSDSLSSPCNITAELNSNPSISDDPSSSFAQGIYQIDSTNCNTVAPEEAISHFNNEHDTSDLIGITMYATSLLPGATGSLSQHHETDFDQDQPLSLVEESRKDGKVIPTEKLVFESHGKDETSSRKNYHLSYKPQLNHQERQQMLKNHQNSLIKHV